MRRALLAFAFALAASPALAEDGWELAKDEDGIQVYLREVPGSSVKEYRGVTEYDCPLGAPVAMLQDPAGYPAWLHNAEAGEIAKTESGTVLFPHVYFDMPWPAEDRDMVFKGEVLQDPETQAATVRMTGAADLVPEKESYVRMPVVKGGYTFTPKGGKVVSDYRLHVEPGGSLPGWLVNALVVDTPFETQRRMREVCKTPKYRDARPEGVRAP